MHPIAFAVMRRGRRVIPYTCQTMDLAEHFRVIAQNWVRIVVISFVVAIVVFGASSLRANKYQAKETLAVQPGEVVGGQTEGQAASFLAQTYAKYAEVPSVVRAAIRDSGLDLSVTQATDRISAKASGELGFLDVKVTGPTKEDAERLTSAVAEAVKGVVRTQQAAQRFSDLLPLQTERQQLTAQLNSLPEDSPERLSIGAQLSALNDAEGQIQIRPSNQLNSLSSAIAKDDPVSPKPLRDAILAFLVSLVVVGELTVLVHYAGDRFSRSEDTGDVSRLTGLPVLAKIPRGSGIEVVESFRVLRTNLMVLEGAGKPRTVAIVSANQAAGKTFTATNLSESAANLDEKVVLIDADLRKPAIHERLGVPRAPGLSTVLQGGDLTAALQKIPDSPWLRVLPSGEPVHDASGMLGARAFRHVLEALRAVRLVLVDTPPAALFADAMAIASQCDATIFVLDVKTSRRRQVRQTLEALERAGANLIGVVINRTTAPRRAAYYES